VQQEPHRSHKPFVWRTASMLATLEAASRAARDDAPILMSGREAVGKAALCRYIHEHSSRKDGAFAEVVVPSLSSSLLRLELWGDGTSGRDGALARANQGTLLVRGIEYAPRGFIAALLAAQRSDGRACRLVCTTHREPARLIDAALLTEAEASTFKHTMRVPSLEERRSDLPDFARHLIRQFATTQGYPVPIIPEHDLIAIQRQRWIGGILQFSSVVEHSTMQAVRSGVFRFPPVVPRRNYGLRSERRSKG
jgi:DNA-binding NtrC family response regulator